MNTAYDIVLLLFVSLFSLLNNKSRISSCILYRKRFEGRVARCWLLYYIIIAPVMNNYTSVFNHILEICSLYNIEHDNWMSMVIILKVINRY